VANTRSGTSPAVVQGMTLGPDGALLVFDANRGVLRVDTVTGTSTVIAGPFSRGTTPYGGAYNPWQQLAAEVNHRGPGVWSVDFLDVTTGTWTPLSLTLSLTISTGGQVPTISAPSEQPFLLYGHGCPGAGGVEPRLRWSGLPVRGATTNLLLRNATSGGFALCLFGSSRSTSPFGPLPLAG